MTERQWSEEQQQIRADFIKARGYWKPWVEQLLEIDPQFVATYSSYGGYAAANGPLSERMCELVYVALDASATHLFVSGLTLHMRLALEKGASAREIVAVLRLATAQGLNGTKAGTDILVEELAAECMAPTALSAPLSPAQAELKRIYEARFGDWPVSFEHLLRLDPGYFAELLKLLGAEDEEPALSLREEALISVALNACFTGLDHETLRLSIRRALRQGATRQELMQVMQMTAHLGVHSFSIGMPALAEATASLETKANIG